ncbi:hypothetical protein SAMN05880582_108127 [Rhizobium sp. RU20A]|nr:hypothetical protein SAMN05880582_108127 [Rhizobium sp. RU20A]
MFHNNAYAASLLLRADSIFKCNSNADRQILFRNAACQCGYFVEGEGAERGGDG